MYLGVCYMKPNISCEILEYPGGAANNGEGSSGEQNLSGHFSADGLEAVSVEGGFFEVAQPVDAALFASSGAA
jgi:hypothetical protein